YAELRNTGCAWFCVEFRVVQRFRGMFNLTRQEKQVLLFVGAVVLSGIAIGYLQKISSSSKVVLPQDPASIIEKKVNLNKAGPEELIRLPEIGPVLAGNIIKYRDAHGPFSSFEDLRKVKGIGPKKLKRLKDYIEEDKSPQ
ncbi:MAG: helix-hairpin-helix domain-containing protein, partial [Candidatus Omnitrophota bacterium]